MQTLFKLTAQDGATYDRYKYGEVGRVHAKPFKKNPLMCSSDVFHAYRNKNLAFLLNPIHADIAAPRLWEIKGDVVCSDFGKVGSLHQEVVRELEVPEWVDSEKDWKVRLTFAILCAEEVLDVFESNVQSDYRPRKAIEMARKYLTDPSSVISPELHDAANESNGVAADAADAAARAAGYAAYAARAARAAAHAAAHAAGYAGYVARAAYAAYAADAAAYAARAKDDIGIAALADKAVSLINNG